MSELNCLLRIRRQRGKPARLLNEFVSKRLSFLLALISSFYTKAQCGPVTQSYEVMRDARKMQHAETMPSTEKQNGQQTADRQQKGSRPKHMPKETPHTRALAHGDRLCQEVRSVADIAVAAIKTAPAKMTSNVADRVVPARRGLWSW